jgi:hypothetical protein
MEIVGIMCPFMLKQLLESLYCSNGFAAITQVARRSLICELHSNNLRPAAGYLPSKSHMPLGLGEETKYNFAQSSWYNYPLQVAASVVLCTSNQECFIIYPFSWLNCRLSRPLIVRPLKFPEVWRGSICKDAFTRSMLTLFEGIIR